MTGLPTPTPQPQPQRSARRGGKAKLPSLDSVELPPGSPLNSSLSLLRPSSAPVARVKPSSFAAALGSSYDRDDLDMCCQRDAAAKELRCHREMLHRADKDSAMKLMTRNFNRYAAHMLISEAAHYQHRLRAADLPLAQRRDRRWFACVHEDIELLFDERRQQDDPTASIRQDFSTFLLFPSTAQTAVGGANIEIVSR